MYDRNEQYPCKKCPEQLYYKWKVLCALVEKCPAAVQFGIGNTVYYGPSQAEEQQSEAQA